VHHRTLTSVLVDDQDKALQLCRSPGVHAEARRPHGPVPVVTAVLDDTCDNLIQIQQGG